MILSDFDFSLSFLTFLCLLVLDGSLLSGKGILSSSFRGLKIFLNKKRLKHAEQINIFLKFLLKFTTNIIQYVNWREIVQKKKRT